MTEEEEFRDGGKLLLDPDFSESDEIIDLAESRSLADGFRYFVCVGDLRRQPDLRWDTERPGFWSRLARKVNITKREALPEDELKALVEQLIGFRLLQTDGRYVWSDRVRRDALNFRRIRLAKSHGGTKGATKRWGLEEVNGSVSNGSEIVKLLEATKDRKVTKEELQAAAAACNVKTEDLKALCGLRKKYSGECVLHYARLAHKSLQSRKDGRPDFVAYVERIVIDDEGSKQGWFKAHEQPGAAVRPERKPYRLKSSDLKPEVQALVTKAGGEK